MALLRVKERIDADPNCSARVHASSSAAIVAALMEPIDVRLNRVRIHEGDERCY
jgi:hypothetical protein